MVERFWSRRGHVCRGRCVTDNGRWRLDCGLPHGSNSPCILCTPESPF